MTEVSNNVAAIIVTYQPNLKDFIKLINLLSPQVSAIYIVNNGSSSSISISHRTKLNIIELTENRGIAFAQNIGLRTAKKAGFDDCILFDQDSLPSSTMISDLLLTRQQAFLAGINVAAVGPVHIDHDNLAESFFIRTHPYGVEKITSNLCSHKKDSYAVCDFLIASGCLISQSSINNIGYMEERLFIDCVDIEWGFRALSKGYTCIAAFDAKMHHKIGETPLRFFGRDLTTHTPLRHYYFFRNFYHLMKRSYIPSSWKRQVFTKSIIQAIIFSLLLSPRFSHFKAITKGIYHALRNKYGKYE